MEHRNRCTDLRHPEALATCCPYSSVHLSNRIPVRPLFASKNDPSDGAGLGGPRVASRGSLLQANLHVHGKLVVQHPSKSKKVGQLPPLRSFNFLTLRCEDALAHRQMDQPREDSFLVKAHSCSLSNARVWFRQACSSSPTFRGRPFSGIAKQAT